MSDPFVGQSKFLTVYLLADGLMYTNILTDQKYLTINGFDGFTVPLETGGGGKSLFAHFFFIFFYLKLCESS